MTKLISCLLMGCMIGMLWQCGSKQSKSDGKADAHQQTDDQQLMASEKKLKKTGNAIVKASAKALKGNLQQAIKSGGVSHAINFCSAEAMPITDSLSRAHDVDLSRVSHKNRNPGYGTDSFEGELIKRYQAQLGEGKTINPALVKREQGVTYYHPIKIKNGLCLNCHGQKGKTLTSENYQLIRDHYPEDQAIGFKVGDLRGLWKVQFKKQDV